MNCCCHRLRSVILLLIVPVTITWLIGVQNKPMESDGFGGSPEIRPVHRSILDGKQIYERQCASCHGKNGEGVSDRYDDELSGELSLEKLTELVTETMPEENPDACVGEDARKVSRYIYDQFYSVEARRKRAIPEKRLARLTRQQLINSIADLVQTFQWRVTADEFFQQNKRGLKATYYHSRHFRKNKKIETRLETHVDVDFGDQLPEVIPKPKPPKKKSRNLEYDPTKEFSIHWIGGIVAEKTGEYEFIVRSENGFRLYVNDYGKPVIDQWVTSTGNEYRAKVWLLGGRVYPFKVDFFRFRDPKSGISVSWKPPHQTEHIIPREAFYPEWTQQVGIIHASLPPDDGSSGYNRGTSVSRRWDEAVTEAASEVSDWCVRQLHRMKIRGDRLSAGQEKRLRAFCLKFVETAFGQKLNDRERKFHVDQFFQPSCKPIDRVKLTVILALKSPRFLYPELPRANTIENRRALIAKRLALYFWDSIPDSSLVDTAARGKLDSPGDAQWQLERLANDYRTRQKIESFFEYWLGLGEVETTTKDEKTYPDFNAKTAVELRQSLDLFVADVFWSEDSDYRKLFSADYMYANASLARFYSLDESQFSDESNPRQFIKLNAGRNRAGLITHPYLMTGLSYHKNSSPIHRGVFIARSLLGRTLKQPPDDVEPLTEEFNPSMTTRQRVEHQTRPTACMSCHGVINPLGFSLENFDAVGRFRKTEKEKSIDTVSKYETPGGNEIRFDGPESLAKFVATDAGAQKSFLRHLFQHLVKQPVEAYGRDTLDRIHVKFVADNYNMKKAMIEIARVAAFHDIPSGKHPEKDSKASQKARQK